jgi:hypothetical protein
MATFDEVLQLARALPAEEQQRLARELAAGAGAAPVRIGPMSSRPPAPHSVAWLKAERGHAVLATDTGPAEADIPAGTEAIRGMWADTLAGGEGTR